MPARVVVLADNAESGQALVENVLAPAGYSAVVDECGEERGDVLLVDLSRLRGAPLAGLRARRDAGDRTPAILLAAHLPDDLTAEVIRLNVVDFLVKPVLPDALLNAIEALLASVAARAREFERLAADNASMRRRLEDWRSAVSIGRAVVQIHDMDTLLARIVEAAIHLSAAEEGALFLVEPVSGELVLRASRDAGQPQASGLRLHAADSIAAEVLHSGAPAVRTADRRGPGLKVKTGHLVQALINLPLNVGDRRIGVLGVYQRSRGRTFDDHQLEAVTFLADWGAVAIDSALRFSELRARLELKSQALNRARAGQPVDAPAASGPELGRLRRAFELMADELGRLLAASYGPLRPAQADTLARLRQQATQSLALLDQLSGVPPGASPTRPARSLGAAPQETKP
jgi:two-component system NtrC family sensor kinase